MNLLIVWLVAEKVSKTVDAPGSIQYVSVSADLNEDCPVPAFIPENNRDYNWNDEANHHLQQHEVSRKKIKNYFRISELRLRNR